MEGQRQARGGSGAPSADEHRNQYYRAVAASRPVRRALMNSLNPHNNIMTIIPIFHMTVGQPAPPWQASAPGCHPARFLRPRSSSHSQQEPCGQHGHTPSFLTPLSYFLDRSCFWLNLRALYLVLDTKDFLLCVLMKVLCSKFQSVVHFEYIFV